MEKSAKFSILKVDLIEETVVKNAIFRVKGGLKFTLLIIPYFVCFIQVFLTSFRQVILFR